MPLYRYVKNPPQPQSKPIPPPIAPAQTVAVSKSSVHPLRHYLPFALMALGLILISAIATPIVYHELVTFPSLRRHTLISPLPTTIEQTQKLFQVAGSTTSSSESQAQVTTEDVDYTKASNWFPGVPTTPSNSKITHYTVDIPKLDIENAVVEIGGNDLQGSLVQYSETANPGEFGSPVIFGHSILRQFYSPEESNPNRYMSIFSTIMTLDDGDEIIVNFDGIEYTYRVSDKYEVNPEQVEVLQQRYDRRAMKLITCTPEGTYLRRGVVEAQLIHKT